MSEVKRSSMIKFSKVQSLNDVQISLKSIQLLLNFERETTTIICFHFSAISVRLCLAM